jgi:GTPase SAR1 family protein
MENDCNQYQNRRIRTALSSDNLTRYSETNFTARAPSATRNDNNSINGISRRKANNDTDFSGTYHQHRNIPTSVDYDLPVPSHRRRVVRTENLPYRRSSENSSKLADPPHYHSQASAYYSTYQEADTNPFASHPIKQSYKNYNRVDRLEADHTQQFGLIILGNAGVGKSFLGNILLGREIFVHEFSISSVTHITEYSEIQVGNFKVAVFNIPGLIEADQQHIDLNKREIEKAFLARPNSIVLYVFGNQRGRLRDEDVVAFNAIDAAYSFRCESLVLVMNDLDKNRPSNYEGTTLVLLQQLLSHVEINEQNVCFLDCIDRNNPNQRQFIKEQLLRVRFSHVKNWHMSFQI